MSTGPNDIIYDRNEKPIFDFFLPLPVSVNDLHAPRRGGGVMLTGAARAYYATMKALLPTLWPHPPWQTERLRMMYFLHESDLRRRDVTNYVKSLQDALEGFVYANDSQLDDVSCLRGCLKDVPGVRVVVSVIDSPLIREPLKKQRAARDKADCAFASALSKSKAMRLAGLAANLERARMLSSTAQKLQQVGDLHPPRIKSTPERNK